MAFIMFDLAGRLFIGRQCPALVRLKVRNARGVKVPFRENAFRPVTDRNCDTVRCGGEQREVKS